VLNLVLKDLHASLGRILAEQLDSVFWQQVGPPDAQVHAAILWWLSRQTSIVKEILERVTAVRPSPVCMTAQTLNPVTLVRD
jgi:hypothetical protein